MLDFLSSLLIGLGELLGTLLPQSDVAEYLTTAPEVVRSGVRWLNWCFPVGQCLAFLAAELLLLVTYVAVKWVMTKSISVSEKLVG